MKPVEKNVSRIILKCGTYAESIYRAAFEPNVDPKKEKIIGWVGAGFIKELTGDLPNVKFEYHFTYPVDGNYHHKVWIKNENIEQWIHVYHDRITSKREIKRHNLEHFTLSNDVVLNILKYLDKAAHIKQNPPLKTVESCLFMNMNIIIDNKLLKLGMENVDNLDSLKINSNDIVIDCLENEKSKLVVGSELYAKNHGLSYATVSNLLLKEINVTENVKLGIFAIVLKPDDSRYDAILPMGDSDKKTFVD